VHAIQRHFVDSVLNDTPFESTGEDYLKTVALVEAAYRSAQSNQVENLSASTASSDNL
jgi:predicted dehydrogenase